MGVVRRANLFRGAYDSIKLLHVGIPAHMVSQQVVLLFLVGAGIDGFGPGEPVGEGPQQAVDEKGVVGNSVQVGSHAVSGHAAVAGRNRGK